LWQAMPNRKRCMMPHMMCAMRPAFRATDPLTA
jgi:hypothetical protein